MKHLLVSGHRDVQAAVTQWRKFTLMGQARIV
jgi:hypothetical protein